MYNFNKVNADSWSKIKRILAFVTGIGLWVVSLVFSYNGFGISNQNVAWAGAVLAFAVTVLELIFNTNTMGNLLNNEVEFGEWILVIGGALAYIYDVWTNILGFYVMQNKPAPTDITLSFLVPFLFGALVAILPEPMFVWAMGWNRSNPSVGTRSYSPISMKSHSANYPETKVTPPTGKFSSLGLSRDFIEKIIKEEKGNNNVQSDKYRS